MAVLPMFPLGTVLLPHMVLPLHVFEPRYRAMMDDVLAADGRFGVVLIARGHEVGGGDERTDLGCVARVLRAEQVEDGRWLVISVGTDRFRVARWVADDPYPRAEIEPIDEPDGQEHLSGLHDALTHRVRAVLALQAEVGEDAVPPTFDAAEDPTVACWQLAVLAPLTPLDAQQVLATGDCRRRLELLGELLDGVEETLRFRLQHG